MALGRDELAIIGCPLVLWLHSQIYLPKTKTCIFRIISSLLIMQEKLALFIYEDGFQLPESSQRYEMSKMANMYHFKSNSRVHNLQIYCSTKWRCDLVCVPCIIISTTFVCDRYTSFSLWRPPHRVTGLLNPFSRMLAYATHSASDGVFSVGSSDIIE